VWKRLTCVLDSFCDQEAFKTKSYAKNLCYKFLIFSYTALFILADSTKTNTRTLIFFYYLTRHAKTLKNLEAQAKAVLALCLAESSDKAPRNYSAAVKQAPFSAVFALRAHKAFTLKVD
jgi:hypothetical protein